MKAVLRGCVPTWSPTVFSETHHLDSSSEYEATQLGFQAYVSPIFHSPSPFLSLSSEHAKHIYYPTHLGKFSTDPTEDPCSGDDNSGTQVGLSFKLLLKYIIYTTMVTYVQ